MRSTAIIRLSVVKVRRTLAQRPINLEHKKKRIKTIVQYLPTRPSFDQIESDAITKDTKEEQTELLSSSRISLCICEEDVAGGYV
jgi:hypothetical protein